MEDAAIALKRAESQQKLLFEIIKRYDGYIAAANAKVAVILSYSMAYIGGVVFKVIDLSAKRTHDDIWWAALILAALSIASTFYAASLAYAALNPQTPPGRAQHEQPSIVFFGDVASLEGGRDGYVSRINTISEAEIVDDLACQAFVLASIVSKKMMSLKKSIATLVKAQLPLSLATILLLCLTLP
ncbi:MULTISPECIES: Pycsar system effector family protein [unclassified Achromobacter]|uniref:Pycsar system effector family protein n=1 Tax=unclassified Achromobacter TaxID=2626865 RepID=UPI0011775EC2|nr:MULTISPECIES: Pycsar system effector family protein [unclassified Achromobacter]